jgi:hypothetical protein
MVKLYTHFNTELSNRRDRKGKSPRNFLVLLVTAIESPASSSLFERCRAGYCFQKGFTWFGLSTCCFHG